MNQFKAFESFSILLAAAESKSFSRMGNLRSLGLGRPGGGFALTQT